MDAIDLRVAHRVFRLDNEQLAFRYTATVSDRAGAAFDRLTDAARLRLWLAANGLDPGRDITATEVARARELREAIYRTGAAIARTRPPDAPDLFAINSAAACLRGSAE